MEHGGIVRRYPLGARSHGDYLRLFEAMAADFGTRLPLARGRPQLPPPEPALKPLLTTPLAPGILYGYGDPSVVRVEAPKGPAWYLVVTSNDAPDAFPILCSDDLEDWRLSGFVFPRGETPGWTLTGENRADFWAPELHRVGDEFWLCFAARQTDGKLAIGLAKAERPEGPYRAADRPLLDGGVIDPHILLGPRGTPHLIWKVDDNEVWPALLAALLRERPELATVLFAEPPDQRTAALTAAAWPLMEGLEPMERFFVLQPLIEAATADFDGVRRRLGAAAEGEAPGVRETIAAILAAMRTRIYAQRMTRDGSALVDEPVLLLENDQTWEGHLIEGIWTVEDGGRYYLFYAANDFSTPHYGIGAAVADAPLGPYRKLPSPILRSTTEWWGPGHPSVALGPDGRRQMFLHAFFPGQAGYKAFRALLTTAVELTPEAIRLSRP